MCEFCTWVCGNSTHFYHQFHDDGDNSSSKNLKATAVPLLHQNLENCQPLLACNSQPGSCSSCNGTCSATVVVFLNSAARILLGDFWLNSAGYEFSFFLLQSIPSLFVETHGDKFQSIVSLQVEAAAATAGGLGDPPDQWNIGVTIFPTPVVKAFFAYGWNRFASHHDLQKGDNLTFSLVSLSRFLVQIFDNNGVRKFPSTTTATRRRRRVCCCNSRRSSEDADDHHQCCRQQQQLQLAGISGPAMTQKNSSSMETTTTTTSVVVDDEQRQEVCMSCVSKCSHVTRRRRKKRKMGCGNNNNAMQSAAIVPASAATRFANHTTFPRFTKTVKKSMLYRPELSNASCLVSKQDHGSLSLSLSLSHTHTHTHTSRY